MPNSKGFTVVEAVVGVMLIALAASFAYVWWQGKDSRTEPETVISDQSTQPPTTEISSMPLPAGWTLANSDLCNVGLPLPPKQAPYVIGEGLNASYWKFSQQDQAGVAVDSQTPIVAMVAMGPHDGPGGEVVASVSISCSQRLTTEPDLEGFRNAWVSQYEQSQTPSQPDPNDVYGKVHEVKLVSIWGKDVFRVTVTDLQSGGNAVHHYYLTVHNQRRLELFIHRSNNAEIAAVADQIFAGIQFK